MSICLGHCNIACTPIDSSNILQLNSRYPVFIMLLLVDNGSSIDYQMMASSDS